MRLSHYLEYALTIGLKGMIRALPHRAARRLGAVLGEIAYRVDRRHRWVAENNLELALPELSPSERRQTARKSFRQLGGAVCEALSLPRFDPAELCRHVTMEGGEHLLAAAEPGRASLFCTAHLGIWEVTALAIGIYHGSLNIVARPAGNPLIERQIRAMRERFGNTTIYKRGAARSLSRAIRQGQSIGILIDQRVHPHEGIEVPFFGHPAVTTPLLARLSLRHQVPVVPVFGFPLPRGRYLVAARPPIHPAGSGDEAVAELTARYLAAIEAEIRSQPELWLWQHERWLWLSGHPSWRKRGRRSLSS